MGKTAPLPLARKSHVATVKVQRESTISSTNNTEPGSNDDFTTASDPSMLRACWVLLAIVFCSGRSSVFRKAARKGSPNLFAKRAARSGTRSGCLNDGTQVTHVGVGRGFHSVTSDSQAVTRSSENRPARYLPSRTNLPQPASPQTQSALPGFD